MQRGAKNLYFLIPLCLQTLSFITTVQISNCIANLRMEDWNVSSSFY